MQRSKVLQAVQRSETRLRGVISSINEGMFVIRPDGRVESWNDAAERATGVPRAAVLGQPLDAALPAFGSALAATAPPGPTPTARRPPTTSRST